MIHFTVSICPQLLQETVSLLYPLFRFPCNCWRRILFSGRTGGGVKNSFSRRLFPEVEGVDVVFVTALDDDIVKRGLVVALAESVTDICCIPLDGGVLNVLDEP